MKKILIIIFSLFIFSMITYIYAINLTLHKSTIIPWQGTQKGYYDYLHNVGSNYKSDSFRFVFLNGISKGEDILLKDNVTGLIWETIPSNTPRFWLDAVNYCDGLEKGGYNDWRLPSIMEISTIFDYSKIIGPFINIDFFGIVDDNIGYWSFTTLPYDNNKAWSIRFSTGEDLHSRDKNLEKKYSLCVH